MPELSTIVDAVDNSRWHPSAVVHRIRRPIETAALLIAAADPDLAPLAALVVVDLHLIAYLETRSR